MRGEEVGSSWEITALCESAAMERNLQSMDLEKVAGCAYIEHLYHRHEILPNPILSRLSSTQFQRVSNSYQTANLSVFIIPHLFFSICLSTISSTVSFPAKTIIRAQSRGK